MSFMCKKHLVKHLRNLADKIEEQDGIDCNDCSEEEHQKLINEIGDLECSQ